MQQQRPSTAKTNKYIKLLKKKKTEFLKKKKKKNSGILIDMSDPNNIFIQNEKKNYSIKPAKEQFSVF